MSICAEKFNYTLPVEVVGFGQASGHFVPDHFEIIDVPNFLQRHDVEIAVGQVVGNFVHAQGSIGATEERDRNPPKIKNVIKSGMET